jgi:hypothetical protein
MHRSLALIGHLGIVTTDCTSWKRQVYINQVHFLDLTVDNQAWIEKGLNPKGYKVCKFAFKVRFFCFYEIYCR